MKILSLAYVCLALTMGERLSAQNLHIPPCRGTGHSTSICWGYAMGRAFGIGWSSSPCAAGTLNFNQVNTVYFTLTRPQNVYDIYNQIQVGDIIEFENGAHVAYVRNKSAADPSYIWVDQVNNQGGTEQTYLQVSQVINGSLPGVTQRGQPTGYYRKNPLWRLTLKNNFVGGTVGRKIGTVTNEYSSPYTTPYIHWSTYAGFTMVATMNGLQWNGYVQRFQLWTNEMRSSNSVEWSVPIDSYVHSLIFPATFGHEDKPLSS